jgi:hypothetical protein
VSGVTWHGAGFKFDTTSHAWGERSPDWQLAWPPLLREKGGINGLTAG